jgi:hypothetical protein
MIIYTTIQTYTHIHNIYICVYIYIHNGCAFISIASHHVAGHPATNDGLDAIHTKIEAQGQHLRRSGVAGGMTNTVCPRAKALTYKAPEDIAITCNNQSMIIIRIL